MVSKWDQRTPVSGEIGLCVYTLRYKSGILYPHSPLRASLGAQQRLAAPEGWEAMAEDTSQKDRALTTQGSIPQHGPSRANLLACSQGGAKDTSQVCSDGVGLMSTHSSGSGPAIARQVWGSQEVCLSRGQDQQALELAPTAQRGGGAEVPWGSWALGRGWGWRLGEVGQGR